MRELTSHEMTLVAGGEDNVVEALVVVAQKVNAVYYAGSNGGSHTPVNSPRIKREMAQQELRFALDDLSDFLLTLEDKLTIGTQEQKLIWADALDSLADQSPYTDLDQDGDIDLTDAAKYHWNHAIEDASPVHAGLAAIFARVGASADHVQGEVPLAGGPH